MLRYWKSKRTKRAGLAAIGESGSSIQRHTKRLAAAAAIAAAAGTGIISSAVFHALPDGSIRTLKRNGAGT